MSQTVEIALFYYRCKRSQLMRDPLKICHVSDCWVRGPAAPVSCVYGIWEWHTIYVITKHTDKGVSGHRKLLGIALRTSRPGESLHLGVMRCVSKIKAAFRRSMTQSRGKSLARLEGIRRPRCIVKLDLSVHVPETGVQGERAEAYGSWSRPNTLLFSQSLASVHTIISRLHGAWCTRVSIGFYRFMCSLSTIAEVGSVNQQLAGLENQLSFRVIAPRESSVILSWARGLQNCGCEPLT